MYRLETNRILDLTLGKKEIVVVIIKEMMKCHPLYFVGVRIKIKLYIRETKNYNHTKDEIFSYIDSFIITLNKNGRKNEITKKCGLN